MKYMIISDEDTALGFGILGVPGRVVTNAEEAQRAFQESLEDKQTGIIIITERIADMIRPMINQYLFTVSFPLELQKWSMRQSGLNCDKCTSLFI
jgi:V/A-type H+-transporting ATPase subunit F